MRLDEIAPTQYQVPAAYREDPRGRITPNWHAVVSPQNPTQLSEVIQYANENIMPIVPFGGGTGLVGGQFYDGKGGGAICLSMRHFNEIEIQGDTVRVGAGVILDNLHQCLMGTKWRFPMALASSGSAQIGGLIATNAGGVNVIRYGNMGENVLGMAGFFPDGQWLDRTHNLRKDNTGYPLDRYWIGAEGTLGVVTQARLRLVPRDLERTVMLAQVDSPKDAQRILTTLTGLRINAFELISGMGLRFREEAGMENSPIGHPDWSVLIDIAEPVSALSTIEGSIGENVIAMAEAQIQSLWSVRETIPIANRKIGAIASHDISLPLDKVAIFIKKMQHELQSEDVRINAFGHLGDGNLHYNLFPQTGRTREEYDASALSLLVYETVVSMGGSISAEHGIGRVKGPIMAQLGQGRKLAVMAKIQSALDPAGIMNPGVFRDRIEFKSSAILPNANSQDDR